MYYLKPLFRHPRTVGRFYAHCLVYSFVMTTDNNNYRKLSTMVMTITWAVVTLIFAIGVVVPSYQFQTTVVTGLGYLVLTAAVALVILKQWQITVAELGPIVLEQDDTDDK